ncbi:DNA integrity scanning protein DisA nucleotide-binding domain protein [Picosynechococcus sp. PCC 7117]|uniref:DNA integrity scanning protein DisA nucleotide-binding domain protein n=1 Tax=Picosynechococcus sp. PCC 7117 TaxID=195498 RepID=UPI0008108259|nr:DNA integrity scanning protein DisA nucleotide-binding domain protein [Picosynechococcus sp. PCC 7117]ANV89102.1 hypothetical protein AWQ22_16055 [Picosynechococcus sp. PCC 7117]
MMTLPKPENMPLSHSPTIQTLIQTIDYLSQHQIGALLIIERQIPLTEQDALRPGVPLRLPLTQDNLVRIFRPSSPLHDGATQIRGQEIIAAGTLLPLSCQPLPRRYGTRHLAALGISEQVSSCVGIVVSEETGGITLTHKGSFNNNLTLPQLQIYLQQLLLPPTTESLP